MSEKKIAFVVPWYDEDLSGGAETEQRELAHHLIDQGVSLEVLTTCVKSFRDDWNIDFHKPGASVVNGIPVRRFPVRKRDTAAFDAVNRKLMNGERISPKDEEIFCREMINSPKLYEYLRLHRDEYAFFVFIPYMFGTTYNGCRICPKKSVLIPCFHDEAYAYLRCFKTTFSKVNGMVFNAEPERLLAKKLYGVEGDRFVTFGIGMETDWSSDASRFRAKHGINAPFILYAGRKDEGKGVHILIRNFISYKRRHGGDLKLVLIGGGQIEIPDRNNILDLGFVDQQDKYDAYAAASIFCNPSQNESFSLVIMESWLAGRPVLVNGKCAVTRDFVHQCNGGLYYESYPEFEKCVEYLLSHNAVANQMGRNGGRYVRAHFAWDVIIDKYKKYFDLEGAANE